MFLTTIAIICVSLLTTLPQSHSEQHDSKFTNCSKPFKCGTHVYNISYPFWGGDNRPYYCGGSREFELRCDHNQNASIQIGSQNFGVSFTHNATYTVGMIRNDLIDNVCSPQFKDNQLSPNLFSYPGGMRLITIFYHCPSGASYGDGNNNTYTCPNDEFPIAFFDAVEEDLFDEFPGLHDCGDSIHVPESQGVHLNHSGGIDALYKALGAGFEVKYNISDSEQCIRCVGSGGVCGTNDIHNYTFTCHCPDGSDASDCYGNIPLITAACLPHRLTLLSLFFFQFF